MSTERVGNSGRTGSNKGERDKRVGEEIVKTRDV